MQHLNDITIFFLQFTSDFYSVAAIYLWAQAWHGYGCRCRSWAVRAETMVFFINIAKIAAPCQQSEIQCLSYVYIS